MFRHGYRPLRAVADEDSLLDPPDCEISDGRFLPGHMPLDETGVISTTQGCPTMRLASAGIIVQTPRRW